MRKKPFQAADERRLTPMNASICLDLRSPAANFFPRLAIAFEQWFATPVLLGSVKAAARKRAARASRRYAVVGVGAVLMLGLAGCRQDMQDQPKYIPMRPASFLPDGRSERPLIEG